MTPSFDLLVIGGGINGAAIARDAAGRGMKVMLAEKNDYASGTSSASSGLIHGGLRYLEQYRLVLVRESLKERSLLLQNAPHLVHPLRFLLPITGTQPRGAALVRAGLKIYDLFSLRGKLPRSGKLSAQEIGSLPRFKREGVHAVLHYHDAQADDARLVLANLLDARERGADVLNRRTVTAIALREEGYTVVLSEDGTERHVSARFIVNAAGPWIDQVNALFPTPPPARTLRLVRGSHVVLKMPEPQGIEAYTLQNGDGRIVFVLPWLDSRFIVIGTTDVPHAGDPGDAVCTAEERDYLLRAYNARFIHRCGGATPADIVYSWSGVRALVDDGEKRPSRITREAELSVRQQGPGGMVTVYGGKLTTHRALAEEVMKALGGLGAKTGSPWTAIAPLYGGTMNRATLLGHAAKGPSDIDEQTRRRWALTYGDRIELLFQAVAERPELATEIAPGAPEIELMHSVEAEDARTAEDFLIRRTKLGLVLREADRAAIRDWFSQSIS